MGTSEWRLDILLDTGAEFLLTRKESLPENYRKNGSVFVKKCGHQAV